MMQLNSEYIDMDDALPRLGGSLVLYRKLLGRFLEGDHFGQLEAAIASGDAEEAKRAAHSLKGVAANLSLAKVHLCSAELEQLLKDGADYADSLAVLKDACIQTSEMVTEFLAS